jgi:cysteine synthase A
MHSRGERGAIVLLLCDRGERYRETLFDPGWRERQGLDPSAWLQALEAAAGEGELRGEPQVHGYPRRRMP